jgi:threonine synthase
MDISKASNFERFVFDIVGRDADIVRELWWQFDSCGEFDLSATPWWPRVAESGFVSGTSTHADRLATIRDVYAKTGTVIDPHTADGVKVARAYVEPGVPMLCLETALPIKFADTIVEALGIAPERPAALRDLETLPQRVTVLPADAARVREFLAAHDG